MKIAFFSPFTYSRKLGATKNRIELAEAFNALGWKTNLIGLEELDLPSGSNRQAYNEALKNYLEKNAQDFDVVLYEYNTLPFNRNQFSPNTLFVARPALLHYNYEYIKIPLPISVKLKKVLSKLLRSNISKSTNQLYKWGEMTLRECDLIQVQSNKDKELLQKKGFQASKIIVVPNGLSNERIKFFNAAEKINQNIPKIAFVGTFDYRKGAMDFPFIVNQIRNYFPRCEFKLIGTKGVFTKDKDILRFFHKKHRKSITIIPQFEPDQLPNLLSDCSLGIFPSYHESFGFGALEMMAGGLPVVSYNVSGPSDFVLPELLVPIGDRNALVAKVLELLNKREKINTLSQTSQEIANNYLWENIAKNTAEYYLQHIAILNKIYDQQNPA